MGVGPNYVLDKGYLVEGTAAIEAFTVAIPGTGEQTAITPTATSATVVPEGIWQETVDAGRVATGKVIANVALLGLSRAKTGAAVPKGSKLTYDATGRVVPVTRAVAGAQPVNVLGVSKTAATAANQFIDVLLTPGASY